MTKVKICIELAKDVYHAYELEAEREKVTVESLVEQTVNNLMGDLIRDEEEGTDHPVIPA